MKRYFAYGSNMDEEQMAEPRRCPEAEKVGNAQLSGYEFFINVRGVASIREQENKIVYGIIYNISEADEKNLDLREGFNKNPRDYDKKDLPELNAFFYIDPIEENGSPREGYVENIIKVATVNNFPKEYIAELERWLK